MIAATAPTDAAPSVTLSVPGTLPASGNTLAYVFGSALAEAAEPLRAAFLEQLPAGSPLRQESRLEAEAHVAFADRRHRAAHNLEPVLHCALEAALEEAGWQTRSVNLTVKLRGSASRPGTTICLEGAPR